MKVEKERKLKELEERALLLAEVRKEALETIVREGVRWARKSFASVREE